MRRWWATLGVAWFVLACLSTLWAFATPPGASPDEPAHAIKAASVVRGQFIGEVGPQGHIVQVPAYVSYLHQETCYAFDGDEAADCAAEISGDPSRIVDSTTTAGLYNPVYYEIVGWPSLVFGDESGIYAMRIVSGLITSLFLAIAIAIAATWARPAIPVVGTIFAATPMTLFLGGTINPNGLETAATLALFMAMLAIVRQPSADLLVSRAVVVMAAGVIAANARGLSLVWLAAAIIIPLTLASGRQLLELIRTRLVQVTIAVVLFGVVFGAVWLLASNSLGAGGSEYQLLEMPYTGSAPWVGFGLTLAQTFNGLLNMIGVFGWLDTASPADVYFVWQAVIGTLIIVAIGFLRGRSRGAALALIAVVVLLPPIFQAGFIGSGGYIWQGRYALPALACMIAGLAALVSEVVSDRNEQPIRRIGLVVLTGWGAAQFYAFAAAMKRYVVGEDRTWGDFLTDPEWLPPAGSALLLVVFAGIAVAAVWAASTRLSPRIPRVTARTSTLDA